MDDMNFQTEDTANKETQAQPEAVAKKPSKIIQILKFAIIPLAVFFAWLVINYVVQFLFSFFVSIGVAVSNPGLAPSKLESMALDFIYSNISLMYLIISVVFIGIFLLVQKLSRFSRHIGLEYKKPATPVVVTSLLIGTFIGVIANIGLELMSSWLPKSWVEGNQESVSAFDGGNEIIMLLAVVVCAPIVEELLFRGFIYNALKKVFNIIPKVSTNKSRVISMVSAAVLTSALFGIYHGNILQALYTGVLSLFMVWVYEMSGSIFTSILVHCAFNFAGMPTYLLQNSLGAIPSLILCGILALVTVVFTYRICRIKAA